MNTLNKNLRSFSKATALKGIFIPMFILIGMASATAQSPRKFYEDFGARVSTTVSANRFGMIYSPSLFYKSDKHLVSLGTTIQKQKFNVSGVQANYEYTLMDGSKHYGSKISCLELYAYATAAYHGKAFLGKGACEEERSTNSERPVDMSKVQLKAIDAYAGFGLRVEFLDNFKWFSSVGVGGYSVLNAPSGLYYNKSSVGLMMRTGISFQFERADRVYF